MSDDDIKWVADSRRAWGASGLNETDAIYRMARHWYGDPLDTEKLVVWKVRGFNGGGQYQIDADEVLSETWFKVDGDDLRDLIDAADDIDLLVEDLLVDRELDPEVEA